MRKAKSLPLDHQVLLANLEVWRAIDKVTSAAAELAEAKRKLEDVLRKAHAEKSEVPHD